ncbi:MAG: hypothetical protein P8129_21660 [Anaerolineae bacterium]
MAHKHTTEKPEKRSWLQSVREWLAHPTAEALPPIFGDAVPPDLKVFEAQVDEARHEVQEVPAPPAVHDGRSKQARRKKSSASNA